MSQEENVYDKDFKIVEESVLLTPLEWGAIYSLTYIVIEYFLVDSLSEWAIEAFYNFSWIFSIIYLILAVKEARDKKYNGTIGFWERTIHCCIHRIGYNYSQHNLEFNYVSD
jgi:hypothetical protein